MEYVAQLASTGLRFVFKGGTACQILLGGELQRLSIDIDIATDTSEREVLDALDGISARMDGQAYAHAPVKMHGEIGVPLRLFNVTAPTYFPVQIRATMIKLDVVLHAPMYALTSTPLRSFYYKSDISVTTPTASAMLGDKMSTLGPSTIGLGETKVIDNLKQFYDIGNLLALGFDIEEVRVAYRSCFEEVSKWRGLDITIDDAHDDLEGWCKVASARPIQSGDDSGTGKWIQARRLDNGLDGFSGYISRHNRLSKRRLRDIAARIALLSRLLRTGITKGRLFDFVKDPKLFQRMVVSGFQTVLDGVSAVPKAERWHIHIPEYRNNPLVLAAWWGHWDPDGLARLLESG